MLTSEKSEQCIFREDFSGGWRKDTGWDQCFVFPSALLHLSGWRGGRLASKSPCAINPDRFCSGTSWGRNYYYYIHLKVICNGFSQNWWKIVS